MARWLRWWHSGTSWLELRLAEETKPLSSEDEQAKLNHAWLREKHERSFRLLLVFLNVVLVAIGGFYVQLIVGKAQDDGEHRRHVREVAGAVQRNMFKVMALCEEHPKETWKNRTAESASSE